ncbi:MAG: hypothetical protein KAV43_03920 [Hadesarchaea archaeon]|nr:hypothetical protein [Hadesarchaea archaeon]
MDHGEAASQVEEEGTNALEVGPEAHAAEAPQDQAAEDLVDLFWIFKKGFYVGYTIQHRVEAWG